MDLQLAGSVAVVLGGAQGIGRAVAATFAEEGATVVCVDIGDGVVDTAKGIREQHGVETHGIVADITDYDAMQRLAATCEKRFGGAEHVVCAAGAGSGKFGFPFTNLEPSDWPRVLEVNVQGTVNVAHAFTPGMVKRERGTFTFFASVAGQIGSQTDPPYSAAKASVINFTQCVAKDLAKSSVRANCICPGMVKTELNKSVWAAWNAQQPNDVAKSYDEWADEKIASIVPLGSWQSAEEVAAMVVFVASPRARSVTGQTLNVDGGFVMHW